MHCIKSNLDTQVVSSDSEDGSAYKTVHKLRKPKDVVELSDSEDDTYGVSCSSDKCAERSHSPQPLRTNPMNATQPSRSSAPTVKPPSKNAIPIAVPMNGDIPRGSARPAANAEEVFDMRIADNEYDVPMTAADTEKAIRDLVSGAFGETEVEVSLEDAEVPGLDPKFKLLPHQVASRKWMADRETGKKNGGILADDMG